MTNGKAAVAHIGTIAYLIKNRLLAIPIGTIMTSKNGVQFSVVSCAAFDEDSHFVTGSLRFSEAPTLAASGDRHLILTGFLWPQIG